MLAINAKSGIPQADIAEMIRVSRQPVNRHLKILRDAGMVRIEPRGRETACILVNGTIPPTLVASRG